MAACRISILCASCMQTFADNVRMIVARIPEGKTMTYAEVARWAGHPRAARAVGAIMRANFDPKIPCHRVTRADGSPGGYNRGGPEKKREILRAEGAMLSSRI